MVRKRKRKKARTKDDGERDAGERRTDGDVFFLSHALEDKSHMKVRISRHVYRQISCLLASKRDMSSQYATI